MPPPPRSLTQALSSLSLSTRPQLCVRRFSTTSPVLTGPLVRIRKERIATKLKKSKARAADLASDRAARANPILTRPTSFTESLLKPKEILAQPGNASHSRTEEMAWPALTNFGLSSEESLTLAIGAKAAEIERFEREGMGLGGRLELSGAAQFWMGMEGRNVREVKTNEIRRLYELKREVMARLVDMTNACSSDITNVNIQNAVRYFARDERDTGSPEVQIGVMTVRILALSDHLETNRGDKRSKRALNMLVHQRQKMLKYLRRTEPGRYRAVLKKIGLDDIAVVQEVR